MLTPRPTEFVERVRERLLLCSDCGSNTGLFCEGSTEFVINVLNGDFCNNCLVKVVSEITVLSFRMKKRTEVL